MTGESPFLICVALLMVLVFITAVIRSIADWFGRSRIRRRLRKIAVPKYQPRELY